MNQHDLSDIVNVGALGYIIYVGVQAVIATGVLIYGIFIAQ